MGDRAEDRVLKARLDRLTGLSRSRALQGWCVLPAGGAETALPRARLRFEALSGLETALARSEIDLRDKASFHWLCFALLCATLWFCGRFAHSPFGHVLRGARSNEGRMAALGFPVFRYRLVACLIAGAFGGLAGILLANEGAYISPAMVSWVKSGDLIVMVVLGGIGVRFGPLFGALAFFVLEESLKPGLDLLHRGCGEYWQIVFGPLLVIIALYAKGGIASLLGFRHD